MQYLIRENNPGDKDLIDNFNKELDTNGFNFKLPQGMTTRDDLCADCFNKLPPAPIKD